jgi:hypothetical protein
MDESFYLAIGALADATAAKQDQLTAGTVPGGFQLLDQTTKVVRAIKGVSPIGVAVDTNQVEVFLDQTQGLQFEAPVSVTGPNLASALFAGTLVLGKWRLRGDNEGTFYLERFDDDGAVVTDAWMEVARFGWNTNNDAPGFETQNLGVLHGFSAGETYTNTIRPRDAAQVTIDSGLAVTGALSANEPVRVTGTSNPASELFAGTLVLGKWRLRGNEGGAVFLERLDDDGDLQTGQWVNVATFVFNTSNNVPGLDVANLGVSGTTTLGALQMLGDVAADTIRARVAPQVTIDNAVVVTGALSASEPVRVTGPGKPASELYAGTLVLGKWRVEGSEGNALRIQRFDDDGAISSDGWLTAATVFHNPDSNASHLEVTGLGVTEVATLNAVQVIGELTTNTIRATNENQVTIADSLRVTGVTELQSNVAVSGQVAAQSVFCNTDLTVLGNLYTSWTPFWIHGVFDGSTMVVTVNKGRVPFTVTRFATGGYGISWATPHPNGANYTVSLAVEFGVAYIRRREDGPITSTSFDVMVRDAGFASLANRWVHISVLA